MVRAADVPGLVDAHPAALRAQHKAGAADIAAGIVHPFRLGQGFEHRVGAARAEEVEAESRRGPAAAQQERGGVGKSDVDVRPIGGQVQAGRVRLRRKGGGPAAAQRRQPGQERVFGRAAHRAQVEPGFRRAAAEFAFVLRQRQIAAAAAERHLCDVKIHAFCSP